MTIQTTEKQAAEVVNRDFDFSPEMDPGEAITSVDGVTVENMGLVSGSDDVTCGSNSYSGQVGRTQISGGTLAEQYTLTMTVTTDAGQTLVLSGLLNVVA